MGQQGRKLASDWHDGSLPFNAEIDDTAFIETTHSFFKYRSERNLGVKLGRGASVYQGTMFDVGSGGRVSIGDYALINGARIICDSDITIGDYTLISWNVVLMDTYRLPFNAQDRRRILERASTQEPAPSPSHVPSLPINIERNVWIGFDSCILPGVKIGAGSIVGARSVVTETVEPYSVVAGNPARVIRRIDR